MNQWTIEPNTGCWLWLGAYNGAYGVVLRRKEHYAPQKAHRWVYRQYKGAIPEGLTLDHKCRVTVCVNPEHLEPVPLRENIKRGGYSIKTHCIKGHPFTDANTRMYRGWRYCRQCDRERVRQ